MKCPRCLEDHEPQIRKVVEEQMYKGHLVSYIAEYFYCPIEEIYYADEEQLSENFKRMRESWVIEEYKRKAPREFMSGMFSKLIELERLYTELMRVSGFKPEILLEMFLAGYTLEVPDDTKPLWNEIERFASYD